MGFWNKKIINLDDKYFGLDISDFSVKVFQLEKNGDIDRILSYNSKDIKAEYIENGKIINKEKVSEIIKEAIKTSGPKRINTNKVVCSIPESKVFLRTISIPEIDQEEAGEAIKWEIEASIPLSVEQVYFDWKFLDKKNGKQNVLTVAVAKEFVDNLVDVLEYSGLSVHGFEMESIAVARSLIKKDSQKKDSCLIVDIGGEKTSFIIAEGSSPCFTSSIPFSSSIITETISSSLGVSRKEAEKIKISEGIGNLSDGNSVFNAIESLLENLAVEIEKTIDFYQNMSKDKEDIKKIIITGGGANLGGLIPYFTTRLSREVSFGSPWENLNFGKNLPIINKVDSVRFATVIGLAMYDINDDSKLNLIPPQRKESIQKNIHLKSVIRSEIFLTAMMLVSFIVLFSFKYILNYDMQAISQEKSENAEQFAIIKKYDDQFDQINKQLSDVRKVKDNQFYWSKLFIKLSEIVFPGIVVESFSNDDYIISLSGNASTRDNLILFKEKLAKDECFSEVDLPLSDLVGKNDIKFTINFKVKLDCLK